MKMVIAKDPTIIVQAYQYHDFLGTLDVEFDENGNVIGHAGELIKIADKAEDPEATEMLKKYSAKVDEVRKTEIGVTAESSIRKSTYKWR